jgi:hypothetical protein
MGRCIVIVKFDCTDPQCGQTWLAGTSTGYGEPSWDGVWCAVCGTRMRKAAEYDPDAYDCAIPREPLEFAEVAT